MWMDGKEILGYVFFHRIKTEATYRYLPSYYPAPKNLSENLGGPKAYTNSHMLFMTRTGLYHCRNCKLMGSIQTFNEYNCR